MEKNRMRPVASGKNIRMSYSKQREVLGLPNLIDIQKKSYEWFLSEGLKEVFDDISPITDYSGSISLSFEDFEIEYKYLKAVIEGGLEIRPDNVLIYATSNRRNLIKENWSDRDDMENENGLHHSDTVQEKQSLSSRFGVTISFSSPLQKDFYRIVKALADKCPEITLSEEELYAEARKWEIAHGGMSGRCARQFVDHLAGNVKASH